MASPLLECVPNVSEGRDLRTVEAVADAVRGVPGARLADVHADPDHHRSVFTFLGAPQAVEEAALALAAAVFARVDMRAHRGIHPRMGALDVLPFVPLRDLAMADAVAVARRVGERLGREYGLPVYFYGAAATRPERRAVRDIRRGEYEGLPQKLADPAWSPDCGPATFNPRVGAVAVGARDVLVAYNVWLDSTDLGAATAIARAVRESSGGMACVQALGLPLERRGLVQVSMNLLDYRRTGIARAYDAVTAEAALRGLTISRAELVGLAPRAAFEGRAPETVGLPDLADTKYLDTYLS
ncbi:MAG: glutamate formimidoyltransferase [Candidatus Rokubacteria bacterium]|nr:glutamate formimidoyltransferase [Candidatus Rokubacteria bacterium]